MRVNWLNRFAIPALLLFVFAAPEVMAAQKSSQLPGDSRLRYWNYQPNTAFEYTGFLMYAARIDLDPREEILSITMGNQNGWQINPVGHRLFLKPVELEATTNMTIITSLRIYYFEMFSKEAKGLDDPELVFSTSFIYGDTDENYSGFIDLSGASDVTSFNSYVPDPIKDKPMLNMNYTMSGAKAVSPLEVFDDGEFTYIKFRDINADYPAIFQVLPDGNEALINYRISDNGYVVIEMVTSQFTLRFGNQMACIFNESMPLERAGELKEKDDKQKRKIFGIF